MVAHKLNSVPLQARLLKTNRGRLYGLISKIYSLSFFFAIFEEIQDEFKTKMLFN